MGQCLLPTNSRSARTIAYVGEILHITALEILEVAVNIAPEVVKFTARPDQLVVRPFLVPPVDIDRTQKPLEIDLPFKTNMLAIGYSLVTPVKQTCGVSLGVERGTNACGPGFKKAERRAGSLLIID
jgi:hypothetical protein